MPSIFEATEIRQAPQKEQPPEQREYSTPLLGGEYRPVSRRGDSSVHNLPNEHGDR